MRKGEQMVKLEDIERAVGYDEKSRLIDAWFTDRGFQPHGLKEAVKQYIESLEKALEFYAKHDSWMSVGEDGPRILLVALGPHKDAEGNGWCEAEGALERRPGGGA